MAESAALSDICNSSLWLHVRCLAYSATGRLQFLGINMNIVNLSCLHNALVLLYRTIIKNPPPEGVVLSLPLKGDENASCPQRGRGIVSGFI